MVEDYRFFYFIALHRSVSRITFAPMNRILFRSLPLVVLLAITACSRPVPALEGLDAAAWKADRHACQGIRAAGLTTLQEQKKNFLGLSEMQIVSVFGAPDRNELYKRNQKFYYYDLQPSTDCPHATADPLALVVRFNAMGLAKEISIE
jgi:hypothetical protein